MGKYHDIPSCPVYQSLQDPPEEVVQNCNREVDEVLRYATSVMAHL